MFICKSKAVTLLTLCVLCVASVSFGLGGPAQSSPPARELPSAPQGENAPHDDAKKARHNVKDTTAPAPDEDAIQVQGRVLDPNGAPLAGADLYLGHYGPEDNVVVTKRATTDGTGRFDFRIPKSQLHKSHSEQPSGRTNADPFSPVGQVMAVGAGYGCDWSRIDAAKGSTELMLRLVKDVPISGRILDPDGRPVSGAKVSLKSVQAYPDEKLDAALAEFRKKNRFPVGMKRWGGAQPGHDRTTTTGPDGRFRITGLGGERYVDFHVEGPGIASSNFQVMTRIGDMVAGPDKMKLTPSRPLPPGQTPTEELVDVTPSKVYGASFRYLAAPSRPIRGVVTDKVTGQPLAGVTIGVDSEVMLKARTDEAGRFEVLGCAKSPTYGISAAPMDTGHYFSVRVTVPDAPGIGPITADIQLPQGTPIRGKVLDERTGQPIAGVTVNYFCLDPNPAASIVWRGYADARGSAVTGLDGSFAVAALPGPGALLAWAPDWWSPEPSKAYRRARVTAKEWDDFIAKHQVPPGLIPPVKKWDEAEKCEVVWAAWVDSLRGGGGLVFDSANGAALVHPGEKDKELKQDLKLRPTAAANSKGHGN